MAICAASSRAWRKRWLSAWQLCRPVGQDALSPEGRRPQDVDHLLEVAKLPLQVLDVLFEPGALSFCELEAQVEQRRNWLADGEALTTRVESDALLQAV